MNLNDPLAAELMGGAGYDFVAIDLEHGVVPTAAAETMATALRTTAAAPFARTAWNDSLSVQQALDLGVVGAIVPYVNDLHTAKRVVSDARFPPLGARSRGGVRGGLAFGVTTIDYFDRGNELVTLFIMCETVSAVQAAPGIVALDGVDGLFVGPNDLSASFGLPWPKAWDDDDAQLHQAIRGIGELARTHGKRAGILAKDVAMAKRCIEYGFTFVACGVDVAMIANGAKSIVRELRT